MTSYKINILHTFVFKGIHKRQDYFCKWEFLLWLLAERILYSTEGHHEQVPQRTPKHFNIQQS